MWRAASCLGYFLRQRVRWSMRVSGRKAISHGGMPVSWLACCGALVSAAVACSSSLVTELSCSARVFTLCFFPCPEIATIGLTPLLSSPPLGAFITFYSPPLHSVSAVPLGPPSQPISNAPSPLLTVREPAQH